jgi:hypothetical protein
MKKYSLIMAVLAACTLLSVSSCKKEITKTDSARTNDPQLKTNSSQAAQPKIYVSTVAELYAAVNNADNAGSQVILAPGSYVLDASYPNGGRLELQADMSLLGQPGQVDAVLIDESSLPNGSFRLSPTVSTGGIRVGRGSNSIEWLTIKGGAMAVNPFSVIETDLIGTETHLKVSHVDIDCNGSRIGLMLRNRLDEHAGRIVNASLEFSEIRGAINTLGFGIAIQNRISGAQVKLDMKQNYLHGNKIGILAFNGALTSGIENCAIEITSHSDRFEGNGCGMDPSGGTNGSATTFVNNSSFLLKMYGSTIKDNNPAGHPELIPTNGALPGGIYVAASYNSLNSLAALNTLSNNKADLRFWGCDISNNNAPDFYAYGLFSVTNAVLAGINNVTDIHLYGTSTSATTAGYDSNPVDPAGTNVVNVYRY